MKIFVRDDDVLLPSSSTNNPFGRFKQVHEWIERSDVFVHKPGILVSEIKQFPQCIEYIKDKIKTTTQMEPEIHGFQHIDYGKLTKADIKFHLEACIEWFISELNWTPVIWYTPWGASQPLLHEVAEQLDLMLVDTSKINKLAGRYGAVQRTKDSGIQWMDNQELFMHWWEGGSRLLRIVESVKHGSWEAAALANHELFKE